MRLSCICVLLSMVVGAESKNKADPNQMKSESVYFPICYSRK